MIHITFITSLMEAALRNGVPGIEAECGGACSCATCHVYVDLVWRGKVDGADTMEADMLERAYEVAPNSRLAGQIRITPALDGLTVRLPARQV